MNIWTLEHVFMYELMFGFVVVRCTKKKAEIQSTSGIYCILYQKPPIF